MGATSSPVSSTDSAIAARRYARLALVVVLALLGWSAFRDEYGTVPILGDVDTAIHEFGHMLFMPFGIPILGSTMVILGGSLTQVAFPFVFVAYFMRKREGKQRDVFAAMVCCGGRRLTCSAARSTSPAHPPAGSSLLVGLQGRRAMATTGTICSTGGDGSKQI